MKEKGWMFAWGWLKTLLVSYGLTLILILGLSFWMYQVKGSDTAWRWGVYAIYLLAVGVGGFLIGRRMGTRRVLWGTVFALLYVVVLGLLSWAIGDGWQGGVQPLLTTLGLCAAGGAVGAILS